jgi:hypothetical protein
VAVAVRTGKLVNPFSIVPFIHFLHFGGTDIRWNSRLVLCATYVVSLYNDTEIILVYELRWLRFLVVLEKVFVTVVVRTEKLVTPFSTVPFIQFLHFSGTGMRACVGTL